MNQLITLCADDGLGRVSDAFLSDQMRMEILVQVMPEKFQKRFQDTDENFLPVCDWNFVSCDSEFNVNLINWCEIPKSGDFAFRLLPAQLQDLNLQGEPFAGPGLSGTLETSTLPRCLCIINLSHNSLTGTVDLASLPPSLVGLQFQSNNFPTTISVQQQVAHHFV